MKYSFVVTIGIHVTFRRNQNAILYISRSIDFMFPFHVLVMFIHSSFSITMLREIEKTFVLISIIIFEDLSTFFPWRNGTLIKHISNSVTVLISTINMHLLYDNRLTSTLQYLVCRINPSWKFAAFCR